MLTKTKLALAAALIAGSASAAFAQDAWETPQFRGDTGYTTHRGAFRSAPVALDRNNQDQGSFYFSPAEREGTRAYPGDRAGHLVDGGGD